jgi:hypothetical protein
MKHLLKEIEQNVLHIQIPDTRVQGTGFVYVLNDKKYLFSAKHLFRNNPKGAKIAFTYRDSNDALIPMEGALLMHLDDRIDIIAIECNKLPFSGLNFSFSEKMPKPMSDVFYAGFPLGEHDNSEPGKLKPFFKKSSLCAIQQDKDLIKYLLNGSAASGFSGCPVFINTGSDIKILSVLSGNQVLREGVMGMDKKEKKLNMACDWTISHDFKHGLEIISPNDDNLKVGNALDIKPT